MTRIAQLALVPCLLFSHASAQDQAAPAKGEFDCFAREAFSEASADTPQIRINNFSVREAKSFMSNGALSIEVSYAVANRMDKPISVSADFVLFDEKDILLAALNAGPAFDTVQPGKTDTGTGDTFVNEGTLSRTKKICLRVQTAW